MSVAEQTSSGESRGIAAWWQGSRSFLAEVRNEMRRVTWPTRREVQATTIVVILVATFFGIYLYGVDMILGWLVRQIFRLFGAV